jgi:D-inositol-3-phosphate glycosyltransferase
MKITVLNAGQENDYLYGLVSGLSEIPSLEIEVVDSDNSIGLFDEFPNVRFFNLRGDNLSPQSKIVKIYRITRYYLRLLSYTARTGSKVFHIEWENSLAIIDRIFLPFYYKLFGKDLIFTAHNVYKEARDERANFFRHTTLKAMYHLMDAVIVHTQKMKEDICSLFNLTADKVIVIQHGINKRIKRNGLKQEDARRMLGIDPAAHVMLFFGQIDEYKGLDTLIDSAVLLLRQDPSAVLIVAGKPKRQSDHILKLKGQALKNIPQNNILLKFQFIPIGEVETYFSAADCLVLPYKRIYQSGVIFLSYSFGLPIIATDVGSFRDDILEGITGFICPPDDAVELSKTIAKYFNSDIFNRLEQSRDFIIDHAEKKYSWTDIAQRTYEVYQNTNKY